MKVLILEDRPDYLTKMEGLAFIPKVREIVRARLQELGQLPPAAANDEGERA